MVAKKLNQESLKIFFSSEIMLNDFKGRDHELRKRVLFVVVVCSYACPLCKLLKRLALSTPFQKGLAGFWRNQYPEYQCDYDVENCLVFQKL